MPGVKMAIGLMSGTSMDGIDAALVETDGEKQVEVIGRRHLVYPDCLRNRLKSGLIDAEGIANAHDRPGDLRRLEEDLTLYHARIVAELIAELAFEGDKIDLIGFHGQTVLHRPQQRLTVQIGDGGLLARRTGIDVMCDMRANDMKHGGNGAPLVPVYHAALAQKLKGLHGAPFVFVNIGGIANLTWVDAQANLCAFDCGPGNCLMDQWIETHTRQRFDRNGEAAMRGKPVEAIVARYLGLLLLLQEEGRTFDWRDFPPLEKGAATPDDGAASLAIITAQGIIQSFKKLPEKPATLIISGGGVKNRAIMRALLDLAASDGAQLLTAEDVGLDAGFIEAEAWGYLAVRASCNLPLTFPATTGCNRPVSGGVLKKAPAKAKTALTAKARRL